MRSVGFMSLGKISGNSPRAIIVLVVIIRGCGGKAAEAKKPSLTAIELYDGATGAASMQLAVVQINGYAEWTTWASDSSPVDKSRNTNCPTVAWHADECGKSCT